MTLNLDKEPYKNSAEILYDMIHIDDSGTNWNNLFCKYGITKNDVLNDGQKILSKTIAYELNTKGIQKIHNLDDALKLFKEALNCTSENPELHAMILNNIGYALQLKGDTTGAKEMYNKALLKLPNNPVIQENLASLVK